MRLAPAGADPSAQAVGLDPQPGRVNYLLGADRDRWNTGAATFAKVAQRGVYPGIDVVYYGNAGELEYDIVVAPGADAGAVRLGVDGATGLTLQDNGDLVIGTAAGALTQRRPVAYQDVAGARVPVAAEYVLRAGDEVGLRLGAYDASLPLVIDPVLSYSTYIGGTGFDSVQHVAVDSLGAAYVTGFSLSTTTFPATVGDTTFGGTRDAFVAKFSAAGALQWSTYLGGVGSETGFAIAVDSAGAAHIGGNTTSSDFPATAGAFDTTWDSGVNFAPDAFAVKLAADGTSLTWGTYLGGNQADQVNTAAIALGAGGSVIVGGDTASPNYPTTDGAFQTTRLSAQEGFVTKLSSTGAMDWSTYLGGATGGQSELVFGVAVDATGVYVSGSTASPDFPTTVAALRHQLRRRRAIADAFVTKFNLTGTALIYSTFLGGAGGDRAQAIAVDGTGAAYVAGGAATGFPTIRRRLRHDEQRGRRRLRGQAQPRRLGAGVLHLRGWGGHRYSSRPSPSPPPAPPSSPGRRTPPTTRSRPTPSTPSRPAVTPWSPGYRPTGRRSCTRHTSAAPAQRPVGAPRSGRTAPSGSSARPGPRITPSPLAPTTRPTTGVPTGS